MASGASLLGRLLGRKSPEPAPPPPSTPQERAKLQHERRKVERALRQAERAAKGHNCSTCTTAEDPAGVALAQRVEALRTALAAIDARLDAR